MEWISTHILDMRMGCHQSAEVSLPLLKEMPAHTPVRFIASDRTNALRCAIDIDQGMTSRINFPMACRRSTYFTSAARLQEVGHLASVNRIRLLSILDMTCIDLAGYCMINVGLIGTGGFTINFLLRDPALLQRGYR